MTNVKRINLEVVGCLVFFAGGYTIHWWQTRHDVSNAVKAANAAKDNEHAEELRRFAEQRQKENQTSRSIIECLINNKGKV